MNSRVELNPQPLPPRQISVLVAGNTLNDFDAFTKLQRSILDRLGCGGCTSGYDIWWQKFTNFAVDADLNIQEVAVPMFGR